MGRTFEKSKFYNALAKLASIFALHFIHEGIRHIVISLQNANTVAIISYDSAAVLATLLTRDEADLQNLVGTICTVQDNLFIPFFSQIN